MSADGDIIDPNYTPPSTSICLELYKNMLSISIMDVIMFDAQRQGRLSFYITSQGEEGTCVGSASALEKEDVVFSQYREAGVYMQRGFTFEDFMSQLFANRKDAGRGRNMPVHYGSKKLNIVRFSLILESKRAVCILILITTSIQSPPHWQLKFPTQQEQPTPSKCKNFITQACHLE